MEIIRLSDKTFKETIKDDDLPAFRSTNKGGYLSLDPSNRLPHENENRKIKEFNNNTILIRKFNKHEESKENLTFNTTFDSELDGDQKQYRLQKLNEYSKKLLSQNDQQSDENILFNKNQFREILMNVLNITNLDSELPDILNSVLNDDTNGLNQENLADESNRMESKYAINENESVANADGNVSDFVRDEKTINSNIQLTNDDSVASETVYKENSNQFSYANESIEYLKVPDNFHVSTINEETTDVDKILSGGKICIINAIIRSQRVHTNP